MKRFGEAALLLCAALPATVVYAALLGLGLHRHAPAWAISLSATFLLFAPPMVGAAFAGRHRLLAFGGVLLGWSFGLLFPLSVYFPGERNDAVATGLALLSLGEDWGELARTLADRLPEEDVGRPEVPVAAGVAREVLPPARPLMQDETALPYYGEGRQLAIPVDLQQGERSSEVYMMLDTGATYTTLPHSELARLGVTPGPDAPVIKLHTANGEREASVVLLDQVWLGGLLLEGVAVATCDECASDEVVGLLGLNVSGAYNVTIDADRHEVVLARRRRFNRHLDIKPFVDLRATTTRYPGGRVEVAVELDNNAPIPVFGATAQVACGERRWKVELPGVSVGETARARSRLPAHQRCERYEVSLVEAHW